MRIYEINSFESMSLEEVTEQANKLLTMWKHWDVKHILTVNPVTGAYYFVLTIYNED